MKIFTTKGAGKKLGVNDSRVRQLILAGRLPATRFGKSWLIEEKDLDLVRDRRPGRPKGKLSKKKGVNHGKGYQH